jgi:hypothetical protein
MNASPSLLGARTRLLFAGLLVLVGLVPVLYLFALVGWQFAGIFLWGVWVPLPAALLFLGEPTSAGKAAAVLPFIPHIPGVQITNSAAALILGKLHVAVIPALLGCAIVARAVLGILRQRARIRVARQRTDDRVRRIQDYRQGKDLFDERREPYIGSHNADDKPDRWAA